MSGNPSVSCLCVTENRAAFIPWLLWNFERQTWPAKQLVIVDSSERPFQSNRPDVRVVAAAPGSNVPAKRNRALELADGDFIAWFDDDDWQHPERLALLMERLKQGASFAGATRAWFVDVFAGRCRRYDGRSAIIFNSALFPRELARSIRFDESRHKASDTTWLRQIGLRAGPGAILARRELMLWLCHDTNISNPRNRRAFPEDLQSVRDGFSPEVWGETDRRLESLRAQLPAPARAAPWVHPLPSLTFQRASDSAERRVQRLLQASRRHAEPSTHSLLRRADGPAASAPAVEPAPVPLARTAAKQPATLDLDVSVVVRTDPGELGASEPFLSHVVRQAGCRFVQTLTFSSSAPAGAASTNSTLLGALEQASSRFVLVAWAPVLIHRCGESWVGRAVGVLERDPGILLVTNHPGPSGGPPGSPLGRPSRGGSARWDKRLRVWRQRRLAGVSFVALRSELLAALSALEPRADLELWVLAALSKIGADCACLPGNHGWELRVHGAALDELAAALIESIEAGSLPRGLRPKSSIELGPSSFRDWRLAAPPASLGRDSRESAPY